MPHGSNIGMERGINQFNHMERFGLVIMQDVVLESCMHIICLRTCRLSFIQLCDMTICDDQSGPYSKIGGRGTMERVIN